MLKDDVIITVKGGVADIFKKSKGISVLIVDYDAGDTENPVWLNGAKKDEEIIPPKIFMDEVSQDVIAADIAREVAAETALK